MPQIEKGIPIPEKGRPDKYRFCDFEVGDSRLYKEQSELVRTCAASYGKRHSKKFVVRKTTKGARVWRVE